MQRERNFWRDKEKRRAFLLSLLIHCLALFTVIYIVVAPTPIEPENFIVLDLGTPEQAAQSEAATANESAPQAAEPEVASEAVGAPRTPSAETPPAPAAPPQAPPEVAEATPEPPQVPTEGVPTPPASVPAPSVEVPLELPPQQAAAPLPEIDEVEPQPLGEALPIPQPQAAAEVPETRNIAATPRVQVAPQVAVPEPSAQVSVAQAQPVPTPQVQVSTPSARAVPLPEASASVPERTVPQVEAQVTVPNARSVPTPQAQVSVPDTQSTPLPDVQVSVPTPRPLATTPSVQVSEAEPVPNPQVTVTAEVAEMQTGDQAAPLESSAVGGNAPDAGQTQAQADAQVNNTGAAAAPQAAAAPTGAPASRTPYEVSRSQPIAVMLDNALGYPQAGLLEASAIFEMPVEGGLTRLMSVYDNPNSTPREVGPIRSARDYFVQAAGAMDGTLVHVGGSPGALNEIARGQTTLDALLQDEPFFVASTQRAPYSTYASGNALREAVARLDLNAATVLRGSAYRPAEDAPGAAQISVAYSSVYSSGFRYLPNVSQYRWLRNGQDASDASGEAVLADAVVTAQITTFPYPNDPEGRLYLPYRGGAATLFLRGKEIPGTWTSQNGFSFFAEDGEIDLAPYKHWILFAPDYAEVSVQ